MNQKNSNLNDRETILLPDATTSNISGFGLFQRTFFNKLKTQAGIRYDLKSIVSDAVDLPSDISYRAPLNKQFGSFSGSVGATCNVSEELLLRTNFASAFRTPNLAELTSNGPHETRYELGDESLIPENSYEFDLSMHYHKSNVTFDVAGFYNTINNYIFITPTDRLSASGLPVYKYMQSNSFLYGGEAGLHVHPEMFNWLHLVATYSLVIGKQTNGSYLPFVPANKLNVEIRAMKDELFFLHHAFVSVNSTIAFKQDRIAVDETTTDGYTLFDLSVGGEVKFYKRYISVGVSATNLFDRKYIDHLSTLKEVGLSNPGRNIAFTLKVPFGMTK
jgi:iron complex outermembrane recepter protein